MRIVGVLCVVMLFVVSCSSDDTGGDEFLLVLRGEGSAGEGKLVVLTDSVEWFTDEPKHRAGEVALASVADNFDFEAQGPDAPNAAVVGDGIDATLEITDAQPVDGGVRLTFETIRGEVPAGELGEIDVFVDSVPAAVRDAVTRPTSSDSASAPTGGSVGAGDGVRCTVDEADQAHVVCTITPGSTHAVDVNALITAANAAKPQKDVTGSTVMWIQGWGGYGDFVVGQDNTPGYAQTVTTADAINSSELYFWAGDGNALNRAGGASTMVATFEPTDGNYFSTSNGLLLVAGGAGGLGETSGGGAGANGGSGGVAVSSSQSAASAAGTQGGSYNGGGGNTDGKANGGSAGASDDNGAAGTNGIGGEGGRSAANDSGETGWIGGGPVLEPGKNGIGGEGADGPSTDGAGGGGGYGGGGGGGGTNFDPFSGNKPGGGGGGGSWALASTVCVLNAPTAQDPPPSPNAPTSNDDQPAGAVRIVFDLNPWRCS